MSTRKTVLLSSFSAAAAAFAFAATSHTGETAVFSHKLHIESGATCAECHEAKPPKGELPTIRKEHCKGCHGDPVPAGAVANGARNLGIPFPHALHTDVGGCADCHKATADETQKKGEPLMRAERCFACHGESGIDFGKDCAKCHGENAQESLPKSHEAADWGKTHGKLSEGPLGKSHGGNCADCHGDNACMKCHQERRPMSHKLHIEERGTSECSYCHAVEKGALPKLNDASCADCHEGTVQKTDVGTRAKPMKIAFPHTPHEKAGNCAKCHEPTVNGTQRSDAPVLTKAACDACHRAEKVAVGPSQCKRCHGDDAARARPTTHDKAWAKRHGKVAEWSALGSHGEECSLCHAKRECVTCHLSRKPADHTGLWRMRTHGISASFDRTRCKQCHETGACISCHRRTKPLNHSGSWVATHGLAAKVKSNETCTACHSLGMCARCHAGEK